MLDGAGSEGGSYRVTPLAVPLPVGLCWVLASSSFPFLRLRPGCPAEERCQGSGPHWLQTVHGTVPHSTVCPPAGWCTQRGTEAEEQWEGM